LIVVVAEPMRIAEMESKKGKAAGFKEKAVREFKVYWIVAVYLAFVFCAFTSYRRLILSEFDISYLHYGAGVVEALIVAKVILIGEAVGLGKRFEHGPLIMAALFKAALYGLFVAIFAVIEHLIEGLAHGKGLVGAWHELLGLGKDEVLARTLMLFATFIPFFAFWETDRVLGEDKLFALFFQRKAS
jgi:hypothetical protein